jgi:hypothetical protein
MGLLTVAETAERLGVSTRQVQHLAARGEVRSLARGIIDETSVERYLTTRGKSRQRPWSEPTAWAAIALLSHQAAEWTGQTQQSRLRARLRGLSAGELVGRARGRAIVSRYAGHPSTTARLRAEMVNTAADALGLTPTTAVDGYVALDEVDTLVARHSLIHDDSGRFTLRATEMPLTLVAGLAHAAPVLAALDLAESLDIRERRIGLDTLTETLARLRD